MFFSLRYTVLDIIFFLSASHLGTSRYIWVQL
uniref:Uncharacterized protein n=1 Tax=Arundo donax TaxID=35708 RepID=A0A0A8ZAU7_ARUDO